MSTLKEKLKEDLKASIKSSNGLRRELIKVILGEIAIEEGRGRAGFFLNDEGVLAILKKAKKNQELVKEGYEISNREVPEDTIKEIEIIESYLPTQMSEDQIRMLVSDIIEEFGECSIKDMGRIMAKFNSEFPGKANGKTVSQIVKEKLNG